MRTHRSILLVALSVLVGLFLVSCVGPKVVPEDRYYRLPEPKASKAGPLLFSGTIGVARLKTAGLLNERSILYTEKSRPLELRRSHYHHWQEAPATLIQKNLFAYLKNVGVAEDVVFYDPGMRADQVVSGRLLTFERQQNGFTVQAAVGMELAVSGKGKIYKAVAAAKNDSMAATAQAFGEALGMIYAEFLKDVSIGM